MRIILAVLMTAAVIMAGCTSSPSVELTQQRQLDLDTEDFESLVAALIDTKNDMEELPEVRRVFFSIDGEQREIKMDIVVAEDINAVAGDMLTDKATRRFYVNLINNWYDINDLCRGGV